MTLKTQLSKTKTGFEVKGTFSGKTYTGKGDTEQHAAMDLRKLLEADLQDSTVPTRV